MTWDTSWAAPTCLPCPLSMCVGSLSSQWQVDNGGSGIFRMPTSGLSLSHPECCHLFPVTIWMRWQEECGPEKDMTHNEVILFIIVWQWLLLWFPALASSPLFPHRTFGTRDTCRPQNPKEMAQINPSGTNSFTETSTPGSEWLPTPSLLVGGGSRCLSELHLSWRPPCTQVHCWEEPAEV
jgi:hypothetical protein